MRPNNSGPYGMKIKSNLALMWLNNLIVIYMVKKSNLRLI